MVDDDTDPDDKDASVQATADDPTADTIVTSRSLKIQWHGENGARKILETSKTKSNDSNAYTRVANVRALV